MKAFGLAMLLVAESLFITLVFAAGCTVSDPSPSGGIFGDRPVSGSLDAGDSGDAARDGATPETRDASADRDAPGDG